MDYRGGTSMKTKYYMRGLGIGILITTIILSVGSKKETLTEKEIMAKAMELGMVMQEEDTGDNLEEILEKSLDMSSESELEKGSVAGSENGSEIGVETGSDNMTENSSSSDGEDSVTSTDGLEGGDGSDGGSTDDIEGEEGSVDGSADGSEGGEGSVDGSADGSEGGEGFVDGYAGGSEGGEDIDASTDSTNVADDIETDGALISFTVVRGMSSGQVSEVIMKSGLIDDAIDFDNYIKRNGKASVIRLITVFNLGNFIVNSFIYHSTDFPC